MQQINNYQDPQQSKLAKKKLVRNIIMAYMTNGQQLNGRMLSLDEVSYYLGISKAEVIKEMGTVTRNYLGINVSDSRQLLESLTGILISGIFSAQKAVLKQTELLTKAQGDTYKPFISSCLNDSLSNQIKSNQPLLDLLKVMTSNRPTVAIYPQGPTEIMASGPQASEGLTTTKALEILEDKHQNPLLLNEAQMAALERAINLPELPEVRATHQASEDLEVRTRAKKEHRNLRVRDEGIDLNNVVIPIPR